MSLVFQLGFLVYAMYVLLGVLLLSRFVARGWIENVSATRDPIAETVQIGEKIEVTVRVENRGPLRIGWMLIEEALPFEALVQNPPRLRAEGARLAIASLPKNGERTFSYGVEFLMRGYYQIGPLLIESGDLFGLHRRYKILTEPRFVLVYPKVLPLAGYDLASRRPVGEIKMAHRLFEDPSRIAGVRSYQPGDGLNRIHWRASARTGSLQSKVYEPSSVAGASFLLDFHRDSYQGAGDIAQAELAVTTVASLAHALYEMGQQIGFFSNGRDAADRLRSEGWEQNFLSRADAKTELTRTETSDRLAPVAVETGRGVEKFMRILETLARLEWTDGLTFPELIEETVSRLPRDATLVAVLTAVSEEAAILLGNLRRRGFAITAVLVDFRETQYYDWAKPPEWADRLLAERIDFRRVENEAGITALCAEQLMR